MDNFELIDRPKVVIAVIDGEYVGFARKAMNLPDEILKQEALRDAFLAKQTEEALDSLREDTDAL